MRISSIDLSKKGLSQVPYEAIEPETNWIILSDNRITEIDDRIQNLSLLTRLALNDNRIENIDKKIGSCILINWIDLTRNKLKSLPREFANLQKITGLGLSENDFEEIPEPVYFLTNLRKFGFFSNRITRISPNIRFLHNLVKIDLSNNKIREIPAEMMTLTNLNWLNLSNNKIRSIPPEINNLTKLEELGLGMNEIQEIPCMNKLTQLRIFPAFKNKITKIHPSVFSLPSIEKLDFSDNQLDQFPFEALESKKLRYLNLRCNLISSIESSLLNHKLTSKILMIDISENNLKYIPFKFFKIFKQYANVRLGGNPYSLGESKKPINLSLTEICISKILKRSNSLDPWIDKMYNHRNICDFCGSGFVSEPFYLYVKSFIDPESEFVVEKSLCSNACLNKCNKNRVRSIRRQ